jgi:nucleotide-binding universal stress UspA family protein
MRKRSRTSTAPVIVAAFDDTSLGREVVIQAGRQAGSHGYVVVVYAYRVPRRYRGRGLHERRLIAARAKGRRALEELLSQPARLPEATYLPELMYGRPRDTIARIAGEIGASAIVVGAQRGWRFSAMLRSLSRDGLFGSSVPIITVFEPPGPRSARKASASAIPDVEAWW